MSVFSFLPSRPVPSRPSPALPARGRLPAHCFSRCLPAARVGGVRDHGLHHRLRVGEVRAVAVLRASSGAGAGPAPHSPGASSPSFPGRISAGVGRDSSSQQLGGLVFVVSGIEAGSHGRCFVQCSDEGIPGQCGCGRAGSARLQWIRGSRQAVCEPGGRSGLAEDYSEHP